MKLFSYYIISVMGLFPAITFGQLIEIPHGPLRVSANARYFTDSTGKAIYLTGSHTWNNFQDGGWSSQWGSSFVSNPNTFNYGKFLDWLEARGHNFIRLWTPENNRDFRWNGSSWVAAGNTVTPTLYVRQTGTSGNDGLPKFNLDQLNDAYFDRLRDRIVLAQERHIYVSIMLFDSYGIGMYSYFADGSSLPWWLGHPYNPGNNVNGINGGTNDGLACHTLAATGPIHDINVKQKAYVDRVIDTVKDLDNVLFEIANESPANSTNWQNDMIAYIKSAELNTSTQMRHPVGFTGQYGGSNSTLTSSNADWISPLTGGVGYETDPPEVPDVTKVIILDTDHLLNNGNATRVWVWESFLRGYNPIYMDQLYSEPTVLGASFGSPDSPFADDVRVALGYARSFADQINLVQMRPESSKSSTGYCLAKLGSAKLGSEYIVYQPNQNAAVNSTFTVILVNGMYNIIWFKPVTGEYIAGGSVTATTGANTKTFVQPFAGDAILHLISN